MCRALPHVIFTLKVRLIEALLPLAVARGRKELQNLIAAMKCFCLKVAHNSTHISLAKASPIATVNLKVRVRKYNFPVFLEREEPEIMSEQH